MMGEPARRGSLVIRLTFYRLCTGGCILAIPSESSHKALLLEIYES